MSSSMKSNKTGMSLASKPTAYEREKRERLKYNAERMKAKGCDTLATSILNHYEKTAATLLDSTRWSSDEEEGDEEYEDCEDVTFAKYKQNKSYASKMAAVNKKAQTQQATTRMSMAESATLKQKKGHSDKVQNITNGNNLKQASSSKKLDQKTKSYCSPGSISAYRDLQQKQLQKQHLTNAADVYQDIAARCKPDNMLRHREAMNVEADDDICESGSEGHNEERLEQEVQPTVHQKEASLVPAEQQQQQNSEEKKVKRTRGPTQLNHIHARKPDERKVVILNGSCQPVGPTPQVAMEFSRFLGTIARNSDFVPLNYENWSDLPAGTFDDIWNHVVRCYIIPEEAKRWVEETVDNLWRVHKSRTKSNHYYPYATDEERWEKRPKEIPADRFRDLLDFWNLPHIQEKSEVNRANRERYEDVHTLGPKPLAVVRHEMQQNDPNKQPPTRATVYKESRKRAPDRTYITKFDKAKENMDKLAELESEAQHEEINAAQDPFHAATKKNGRKGQVRLHGRGVTQRTLQKKPKTDHYIFPQEFMQSMKSELKSDLKSDFIAEVVPDLAKSIICQFQAANPDMNFVVPDFRFTINPCDASSGQTQQAADQNRQSSVGTNMQNQVINNIEEQLNVDA